MPPALAELAPEEFAGAIDGVGAVVAGSVGDGVMVAVVGTLVGLARIGDAVPAITGLGVALEFASVGVDTGMSVGGLEIVCDDVAALDDDCVED